MKNKLLFRKSVLLILILFSVGVFRGFSQHVFKAGIQQGKLHVKFVPAMTTTLSNMSVTKKNGMARTGLSEFDRVASRYSTVEIKPMFVAKPGKEEAHIRHGLNLWYEITIDNNANVLSSISDFSALSEVASAEPIYEKSLVEPASFTELSNMGTSNAPMNDPGLSQQWHYENDGSENGIVEADINLFEAWETTTGNSNVIVSVHDQGVDVRHEDLAANMWVNLAEKNGQPGVDDDFNGFVDDINGFDFVANSGNVPAEPHGTHVAGTIAAVNNNGIGVAGVAGGSGQNDGARIMTLKGIGGDMAASYVYAADNGAVISQNSWTYTSPNVYEQAVLDAIDYFIAEAGNYVGSPMHGGIVIFAAGNYNTNNTYWPEAYDAVLSVSALSRSNEKAYYSNFAPWVDIAAPGGDQRDIYGGSIGGVLSTLPSNSYGFYQGTSMACPHVSGIAALVVSANGGPNFTNADLWTHLVTGTHDIYQYNPAYEGLLGIGYIDAALAVKQDEGVAPDVVTNLSINSASQDFININWTAVADGDDGTVFGYTIYYSTDSLTAVKKTGAKSKKVLDKSESGIALEQVIEDLLPETKYFFGISAFDRWANESNISEIISAFTTDAPEIAFDVSSLAMTLDASNGYTVSDVFNVVNNADGALKWKAKIRQTKAYSLSTSSINYPISSGNVPQGVSMESIETSDAPTAGTSDYDNDFTTKYWRLGQNNGSLFIIGDEDLTIPNSAATRFVVSDPDGFNLTRVEQFMNLNRNVFPEGILEIYSGETTDEKNLILAQSFTGNSYEGGGYNTITLDHQLFFEPGEVFWVVFHMPVGIQYPLGIGQESPEFPNDSDNCFMSFDVGKTWVPLADAIDDDGWVWRTRLVSNIQPIHEYLTLSQTEGVTAGLSQQEITIDADGANLINGKYYASAVFYSNDDNNRVAGIDLTINVNDHKPILNTETLVDFGSSFVGVPKTLDILIQNTGLGVFKFLDASCTTSNADFDLGGVSKTGIPYSVGALDSETLTIVFTPSAPGNISGTVTLEDYNGNQHTINLAGVGTAPSEINLPTNFVGFTMAIGEIQSGSFDIVNTGSYPLQYYMPRYEDKEGVIQVPINNNPFGYTWENTKDPGVSLVYSWEDISATGEDITSFWEGKETFKEVDLGFVFPLFNRNYEKLYITDFGVLTTRNDQGWVGNAVTPGNPGGNVPISSLNKRLRLEFGGKIYMQRKSGKLIVQYENIRTSTSASSLFTFQTIIYSNGDVVTNYKDVPSSSSLARVNIALEDPDKKFGFVAYDNISSTPPPYSDLTDLSSVAIYSPGVSAIENLSSTSGVLPVGQSKTITFDVNSTNLVEGTWYQQLVVASNDPVTPLSTFTAGLDVISGGVVAIEMGKTAIDFGTIFEGDSTGQILEIKNSGTKAINITAATLANGNFELVHDGFPFELKAKSTYFISIGHNGITQGNFNDILTFDFSDGSQETVDLDIVVGPAPGINVTTAPIDYNLNVGQTTPHTITVENTGAVELEYSISGTEWAYMNDETVAVTPTSLTDYDYVWKSTLDDGSAGYNWEEIVKTGGEQLDNGEYSEWHTKELPFQFKYYGNTYSTIYIHSNGFITFDDNTDFEFSIIGETPGTIPEPGLIDNVIAPFWAQGWYSNVSEADRPITGVFYKEYDDYVIVEFARLRDRAFLGFAFSAQAILYKNGNIKFQYTLEPSSRAYEALVGIENSDGTKGKLISNFEFYIEDEMAIIFSPSNKRTLAAGTSVNLDITIDATHTNGGTYNADLQVKSNVPGSGDSTIPASLTVVGEGVFDGPTEVEFGGIVAEALPNGNPIFHDYDFIVTNTGTDQLTISTIGLTSGADFSLNSVVLFCNFRGCNELLTSLDGTSGFVLEPGEEQLIRVTLNTRLENYDAVDAIVIDEGLLSEITIPVHANVYLPAVLKIDINEFNYNATAKDYTDTGVITIDNTTGQDDLVYDLTLDYNRVGVSMAQSMSSTFENGILSRSDEMTSSVSGQETAGTFNRELSYGIDENNTFLGFGSSSPFSATTAFTAGEDGFNLSHVSTYFSSENSTSSRIVVEIYAGKNIYDAIKLSETEYVLTSESNFKGSVTIPLESTIKLYPHEQFFVTIRYPFGIGYPQGVNTVESLPNTFLFQSGAFWYDMQLSFPGEGWYVKALEETFSETGWIELSALGTVPAGATGTIDISVFAANMDIPNVSANVIINSNDPYNPTESAIVTMHLNQAPVFTNSDNIYSVNETQTLITSFYATDIEGEDVTYKLIDAPVGMTINSNTVSGTIEYSPDYDAAGMYNFDIQATDSNGGSTLFNVELEVVDVNRAPLASDMTDIELNIDANDLIISAATIFSDEDMDVLTYRAEITEGTIANVFASATEFMISPSTKGETTVTLYATDGRSQEVATSFTLSITGEANTAPFSTGIADMELNIDNGMFTMTSADVFTDNDGDVMTFRASSSDNSIATLSASETEYYILPQAVGTTTVTLYASDGQNTEVSISFVLTIIGESNSAPTSTSVADLSLNIDGSKHVIAAASVFTDADADQLQFRIEVANELIAEVATNGSNFEIRAMSPGQTTITLFATDGIHDEVSVSFVLNADYVLGTEQDALLSEVKFYPNPFQNQITIAVEKSGDYQIRLYNTAGNLILAKMLTTENRRAVLDVQELPVGIYLLEMSNASTRIMKRVVKSQK